MRDLGVDKSPMKNHTQVLKIYNINRLKTCESVKEYKIVMTHLIVCNYKVNKVLLEYWP